MSVAPLGSSSSANGHVLLAQRQGTGYADGAWNLPSGKLEDGETISQAAIREGFEEIGINFGEEALRLAHPYTAEGINAYLRGEHYSLLGWQNWSNEAQPHGR